MAASRIRGITIEISGNTTKLTDALKNVDKQLKDTQGQLNDVNRLLKQFEQSRQMMKQMSGKIGRKGAKLPFRLPF